MMKLLALDCHKRSFSLLLCDGDRRFCLESPERSEYIAPYLERILDLSGLQVGDIAMFAAARGPGSFTGLRSCLAFLLGMARGRAEMIRLVPTFEAYSLEMTGHEISDFAVILPAGLRDFYVYRSRDSSSTLLPEKVLSHELSGIDSYCGVKVQAAEKAGLTYVHVPRIVHNIACLASENPEKYDQIELDYMKNPGITWSSKNRPEQGAK